MAVARRVRVVVDRGLRRGGLPARRWKDSYQDELTEAALTHGATYWEWHEHRYGVVFEVLFESDQQWEAFRALPAVRSALDGVPDPVNGLIVYRGRGGGSGPRKPRKPRPARGERDGDARARHERVLHLAGVAPRGVREPSSAAGRHPIAERFAAKDRIAPKFMP